MRIDSRHFLALAALLAVAPVSAVAAEPGRPNILWLSSEDHGPQLGCYGDAYATTPNIDRLAARGMIYRHCWSNAPVCAPARTTIISGLYPTATGAEHMRSMLPFPAGKRMFPQLLREAGYYCSNNAKEDYNLAKPGQVWDESTGRAHWRKRKPGQPFFAVFNSLKSHESQVRARPHTPVHDPAKVRIPAYHPDAPEVRRDWAQYYDQLTAVDADAGARLAELAADGLADDTIVFYWADHGPGMPRCKRWPYNSGLHVPLVVYFPPKYRHLAPADYKPGGASDRLVSFVDFAPTVLSLAGIEPPDWLQGGAFLGKYAAAPRQFSHGFRGRMDERYDLIRSVTDGRFVYVRNYMPHKIHGQPIEYMFQTPTTRVWKRLHDEGKLTPVQDAFWRTKPAEELYDLKSDPDEVRNLARSREHGEVLARLRRAQHEHALAVRDVGLLPEGEVHARSKGSTPYDVGRKNEAYPVRLVAEMAATAAQPDGENDAGRLREGLTHDDSAVRYWAALGLLIRGKGAVTEGAAELRAALRDGSPYVRVVAAEALVRYGPAADAPSCLRILVNLAGGEATTLFPAMAALNTLEALGDRAAPVADAIKKLPRKLPVPDERYSPYIPRLTEDLAARFK